MRKFICLSGLALLAFFVPSSLFAGGAENKHNFSAEYIRTLNRNAAIDSADAVVYNPAGTVRMENGYYMNLSGQYAIKKYSNAIQSKSYEDDVPNIIPSAFFLYKKEKWTGFAAFTVVCGGGEVEYEEGSVTTAALARRIIARSGGLYTTTDDQYLEGASYAFGYTLGGAYAFNDILSVSVGLRYVDAYRERTGYAVVSGLAPPARYHVDYEEEADGWGGIMGVNLSLSENFNIGLRYETKTELELETRVRRDDLGLLENGEKMRRDLPAILALGISWNVTPRLRTEFGFTRYQNSGATWDDFVLSSADERIKGSGYEAGIALEYAFSDRFKGSAGYMLTDTGISPDNMSAEQPELNAHSISAGFLFETSPALSLNFGVMRSFYSNATTSSGISYDKEVLILAMGFQYRFSAER